MRSNFYRKVIQIVVFLFAGMYSIFVEHFMVRDVKYIWQTISYQELRLVLKVSDFFVQMHKMALERFKLNLTFIRNLAQSEK